jgi:hypothetical protein
MKRLSLSIALSMMVAPAWAEHFSEATNYLPKDFPSDARLYLDHRLSCDHWASEGFDNYSGEELKKIKRDLAGEHCERLDRQERQLRAKYAKNAAVIREFNRYGDFQH